MVDNQGDLPRAALPAWHAYGAMQSTKTRHLDALSAIESRHDAVEFAPREERERLARLLSAHDDQVKAFRDATMALKKTDLAAHQALVAHLASLASA